LTAFFSGQPGQAGTRKVKPFRILMKQEMMGWQWHKLHHMQKIICTSLITTSAPRHSVWHRPDALRKANDVPLTALVHYGRPAYVADAGIIFWSCFFLSSLFRT